MLTLPKCELCARYKDDGKHETCEAFPDGIPEDVLWEPVEKECNYKRDCCGESYRLYTPIRCTVNLRSEWYFCTHF